MDFKEYWAIVERDHTIQNPSSPEKLMLLADYCGVRDGLRVLDIGSGKGWLLRTWASRWAISGTGVEINPWFVAEARERARAEGVAGRVHFVEQPALQFTPDPEGYDVVLCIGASFALGSSDDAVLWMRQVLRPGGVLAIGEPFFTEIPLPEAALVELGMKPDSLRDLPGIVDALDAQGLELQGLIVASQDDWDRYENPKWRAAYRWAAEHPEHPERDDLLQRVSRARRNYLRWERRYIGWGIFVTRPVPGS